MTNTPYLFRLESSPGSTQMWPTCKLEYITSKWNASPCFWVYLWSIHVNFYKCDKWVSCLREKYGRQPFDSLQFFALVLTILQTVTFSCETRWLSRFIKLILELLQSKQNKPKRSILINDLRTRIVWDVTTLGVWCCVTLWAVEKLGALKGIVTITKDNEV